jgi:deoxyribonuclease-4
MPWFGAHMSVAGGLYKAVEAARAHGCQAVQLFTINPQSWPVPPAPMGRKGSRAGGADGGQQSAGVLAGADVAAFRRALRGSGVRRTVAHDSYLINLASPDEALFRRSVEAFTLELRRAERLGLHYLVMHPGAHLDGGEEAGLTRVAAALDEVHARCPGFRAKVLLETTAGQGSSLGHRFEHLAGILSLVADPGRLGVCLDTCHVFAAGYALAPEKEYRSTLREFDRLIGLRRLRVFHVNDSLKPFGSRVDRHAAIGQGQLGTEPFRLLVNDTRFRTRPMILETPKEDADGNDLDAVNLATVRGLVAAPGGGRIAEGGGAR